MFKGGGGEGGRCTMFKGGGGRREVYNGECHIAHKRHTAQWKKVHGLHETRLDRVFSICRNTVTLKDQGVQLWTPWGNQKRPWPAWSALYRQGECKSEAIRMQWLQLTRTLLPLLLVWTEARTPADETLQLHSLHSLHSLHLVTAKTSLNAGNTNPQ